MSGAGSKRGGGTGWLVLIVLPPVVVVVGLALFFGWQVRKGTITPKWRGKPATTVVAPTNAPAGGGVRPDDGGDTQR